MKPPKRIPSKFSFPQNSWIELLNPPKSFDHPQLLNCLDIQSTHSPHQCPPPPLPWESQAKMMWRLWKFSFNDILETVDYSTQYYATFRGDEKRGFGPLLLNCSVTEEGGLGHFICRVWRVETRSLIAERAWAEDSGNIIVIENFFG